MTQQKTTEDSSKKKNATYIEIPLPNLMAKNIPVNIFLVFTLLIFSFLLGMLTNKVLYLQEANKTLQKTQTLGATNTAPTPFPLVKDLQQGHLPLLGNKNAKVLVVEFSDFQCPFCEKYFTETHKQLKEAYIDTNKIAFAYRHYPLTSHNLAQMAGEASECANEQNKFWEYHDLLFNKQETWSQLTTETAPATFTEYAGELELNTEQFQNCLTTGKDKQLVISDMEDGNKAQVDGTPTFFVNGKRIIGAVPFSELQKAIEEELKK
jgi:protein-disulfide isomerase